MYVCTYVYLSPLSLYTCIYIYIYVCLSVCVCVCYIVCFPHLAATASDQISMAAACTSNYQEVLLFRKCLAAHTILPALCLYVMQQTIRKLAPKSRQLIWVN